MIFVITVLLLSPTYSIHISKDYCGGIPRDCIIKLHNANLKYNSIEIESMLYIF